MAKTAYSTSARKLKMEVVITAAINTTISLGIGTPPLTADISSLHVMIEQSETAKREINRTHVTGDKTAIVTPDSVLSPRRYKVTVLYTQGKDTVINAAKDFYSDLLRPLHNLQNSLPLQHIWSPAGGEVGDEEYTTDADETYLAEVPEPVGGASSDKIMIVYEFETPDVTVAVIA